MEDTLDAKKLAMAVRDFSKLTVQVEALLPFISHRQLLKLIKVLAKYPIMDREATFKRNSPEEKLFVALIQINMAKNVILNSKQTTVDTELLTQALGELMKEGESNEQQHSVD
jgi:hypothetical protein